MNFEYLSQFHRHFACATKANYSPAIQRKDVIELHNIYVSLSGDKSAFNAHCGGCILKMLKKLSVYYYEELKRREAEQNQLSIEESNEDVKKQVGRRKRKASQDIGEDSK